MSHFIKVFAVSLAFLFVAEYISAQTSYMDCLSGFLAKNELRRFVKKAGSDEKAIEILMAYSLPDTILHPLIWYSDYINDSTIAKMNEPQSHASYKIKSLFWIQSIYNGRYKVPESLYGVFLDDDGNYIYDYTDANIEYKSFVYFGMARKIRPSDASYNERKNKIPYAKYTNESYDKLIDVFVQWFSKMQKSGLQYMRDNNIPPVNTDHVLMKKD